MLWRALIYDLVVLVNHVVTIGVSNLQSTWCTIVGDRSLEVRMCSNILLVFTNTPATCGLIVVVDAQRLTYNEGCRSCYVLVHTVSQFLQLVLRVCIARIDVP